MSHNILRSRGSYITIALSIIGFVMALSFSFTFGNQKPPEPNQLSTPVSVPYEKAISGSGIVEASSRNINIGSNSSGLITKILVSEGSLVKKGDLLIQLDDRSAKAQISLYEKQLKLQKSNIDLAKVSLEDTLDEFKRSDGLKTGVTVSLDTKNRKKYAYEKAKVLLLTAMAQLEVVQAQLDTAKVDLDLLSIVAPVDGVIMKINQQAGEYLNAQGQNKTPILMGTYDPLFLRVQIDENDLWRFKAKSNAVAFLRSNKEINFKLSFVRIDPYVGPKQQLTGDSAERVDTRVLEVVYKIEAPINLYIGQLVDVYIEE